MSLWFTTLYDNRVGRIDAQERVHLLRLPTANSEPYGITTAPNGGIWVTATCISTLVHIARDSRITEWPVDGKKYPAKEYCLEPISSCAHHRWHPLRPYLTGRA